jgi:hypothetical protein
MGFKDYGFGYRNVILMREHSGTFIYGRNLCLDSILQGLESNTSPYTYNSGGLEYMLRSELFWICARAIKPVRARTMKI